MTFRRTAVGLQNQPKFLNTDIVIYIEGINTFPVIEGHDEGDADGPKSQDALFWSGVLQLVLPDTRLHFKPLGSKSELIAFARDLESNVSGKLLVCVDRDLDDFLNGDNNLRFVVTTYRYSWEADVWVWLVFKAVLLQFLPLGEIPADMLRDLRAARDRFFRRASKFVRLDIQTAKHPEVACFLPRQNPGSVAVPSGSLLPQLNYTFLAKRAREYRSVLPRPWRPGIAPKAARKTYFFGKVIDRYHCLLLIYCFKRFGLPCNIPSYVFQNFAIRDLPKQLLAENRGRQMEHYRVSVEAALAG
jgi:hypothetical protein